MKTYICIDLKSFYASVECVERNLDPLDTNLVVADNERTEKTICLAVTPSLKEYGLKGRSRLFEVVAKVNKIYIEPKGMGSMPFYVEKAESSLPFLMNKNISRFKEIEFSNEDLDKDQLELYNALKVWRSEKYNALHLKPYQIFTNQELIRIITHDIKKEEDLLNIKGITREKYEKFGKELFSILSNI